MTAPPGSQSGSTLRLPGKGLPRFGGGARGDLLLRLRVVVPARNSDVERRLYEQLRQLQSSTRELPA